jgi:nitrogen regulatory protein PII-like uncharacterized protein
MNYQQYTDQDLWSKVDEVGISTINDLQRQLIMLGINVDDQDLEEIYELIKQKVVKTVDN